MTWYGLLAINAPIARLSHYTGMPLLPSRKPQAVSCQATQGMMKLYEGQSDG